jgi:pyruvate/2-oxoacid:ferredoxin oxidoreductase beta subunit
MRDVWRFIHFLSPYTPGWKIEEHMAPKTAVVAVETNVFPLREIFDGTEYKINDLSKGLPVETYLSLQGRLSHLGDEDIQAVQRETDRFWENLRVKAGVAACSCRVT